MPATRALRWIVVSAAAAGLALALTLVRVKLRLELDPSYESSCNFGAGFNCDAVQTSPWSQFAGLPLALWGAATYLAVLALALVRGGATWPAAQVAIAILGAPVLLHSGWLAWISHSKIGSFCLYCVGMYAANAAIWGAALWGLRRDGGLAAAPWRRPATWAWPLGMGAAAIGLAIGGFHIVRDSWTAARIAALAAGEGAEVAAATPDAPVKTDSAGQADTTTAAASAAAQSAVAPAQGESKTLTHAEGFRYRDDIGPKGRAYFEVPVTPHDFVLGPADARVTVVEFADFECGYCRSLTNNMKPLKKKYEGRVRWVFKHFPLDNACNPVMRDRMHLQACDAARASNCAGLQGKFWEAHDAFYGSDLLLNRDNLRTLVLGAGVDGAAWDACMADPERSEAKIREDVRAGRFARIAGTPRTYVDGHLVPGIISTEILDYLLARALDRAEGRAAPAPVAAEQRHGMVAVAVGPRTVWIDAMEASIDAEGRARSVAAVPPAEVSWDEADAACAKAGKRLCSETEWIAACAGTAPHDANGNGDPTDDAIDGNLYPYGAFYDADRCHDDAGEDAAAGPTGARPGCRTPSGIADMAGNVAEWTGTAAATAMLSGGDFRYGAKGTCLVRQQRFGRGYRNRTTGFRCCADTAVAPPTEVPLQAHRDHGAVGAAAPTIELPLRGGGTFKSGQFKGQVTIVSFFASWCGPCRREMPLLDALWQQEHAKGLQILGIGVDTRAADAESFLAELRPKFPIALDPDATSLGAFGVKGMPTSFLIDRQGRIAARLVGINEQKVKEFQDHARRLVATP